MAIIYRLLRRLKYRITSIWFSLSGNRIGVGTMISGKAMLRKTVVGNFSYVAEYSGLNCVDTGNYCSIGPFVQIGGMEHPYWRPSTSSRLYGNDCESEVRTIIGDDVWIGAHCYIKQGVHIGNGAVVGAHSFVDKDVLPYAIVFGTPAKVYRMRFDSNVIEAIQKTRFADYPPKKAKALLKCIEDMTNVS